MPGAVTGSGHSACPAPTSKADLPQTCRKPAANLPQACRKPAANLPQGPTKFALEVAMHALSTVVSCSTPAVEAAGAACAAGPLLAPLRHHSCRIQVLCLRMLRPLLRSDAVTDALLAADVVALVGGLLATSTYGAVREEALTTLVHLVAGS
ncbi:hypothetical protein TSOC_011633, partial [Tetrabaena socialis]